METQLKAGVEVEPSSILKGPIKEITSVAFDPLGQFAVAGSKDNRLFSWDMYKEPIRSEGVPAGQIQHFAFSPDGKYLVTIAGQGNLIRRVPATWERSEWPKHSDKDAHQGAVLELAFADEESFFSVGVDGTLRHWNVSDGALLEKWKLPEHPAQADLYLPNQQLVAINTGGLVKVLDFSKQKVEAVKSFEKLGKFAHARFLNGGQDLLLVTTDQKIEVLRLSTGTLVRPFKPVKGQMEHAGAIRTLAVSENEKWVATGDETGRILVWNSQAGEPVASLKGRSAPVTALVFDPEGKRLLSGDADEQQNTGAVYVWDLAVPGVSAPAKPADSGAAQPSAQKPAQPVTTPRPASEPQLLDTLSTYVLEHLDSTVRWSEAGEKHFNAVRFGDAMFGSGSRQSWPPRVARAVDAAEEFEGEIYIVPEADVPGFSGIVYEAGEEKTATFYFGTRLLREAPPIMIRDAITRPETALGPLEQFAAELKTRPPVVRASSKSTPASSMTQTTSSGSATPSGTASSSQPTSTSTAGATSSSPTAAASKPASPLPISPWVPIKQELVTLRGRAGKGILLPNSFVVGELVDTDRSTVTVTVAFDTSGSKRPTLHKARILQDLPIRPLIPGSARVRRSRSGQKKRPQRPGEGSRFIVRMPKEEQEILVEVGARMPDEWIQALDSLVEKLDFRKIRLKEKASVSSKREYLKELIDLTRALLNLPDQQGRNPRARLVDWLGSEERFGELWPVFQKQDKESTAFLKGTVTAERSLRQAADAEGVPAEKAREALGNLLEAVPPQSAWMRPMLQKYLEGLPEAGRKVDLKVPVKLLSELKADVPIDGLRVSAESLPSEHTEEIVYDLSRLSRLEDLQELEGKLQGEELPEQPALDVLDLIDRIRFSEWDSAITHFLAEEAKSIPPLDSATRYRVGALGVLFIDRQGSPRRFVPGGGTTEGQGWSSNFLNFHIGEWYQPGDDAVLLVPSEVTGYPSATQIWNFFNDLLPLQAMFKEQAPRFLLGVVAPDGTVRVFAPDLPAGDLNAWCQACLKADEIIVPLQEFLKEAQETGFSRPSRQLGGMAGVKGALAERAEAVIKTEGYLTRFRGLRETWQSVAATHYDAAVAQEMMEYVDALFGERFEQVAARARQYNTSTNPLPFSMIVEVQQLNYEIAITLAEKMGLSLVGDGRPLVPVEIKGLAELGPPRMPVRQFKHKETAAVLAEVRRDRQMAEEGRMVPGSTAMGRYMFDELSETKQVGFDMGRAKSGFHSLDILLDDSGLHPVLPPPRPVWKGPRKLREGRYVADIPRDAKTVRDEATLLMGEEWGKAVRSLGTLLKAKEKRLAAPVESQKMYLSELLRAADKVLRLRDAAGLDARGRLAAESSDALGKLVPLLLKFDPEERKLELAMDEAQASLRGAVRDGKVPGPALAEALDHLMATTASDSWIWQKVKEYRQGLNDSQQIPDETADRLLQWLRKGASIRELEEISKIVPLDQLPLLCYDCYRVARTQRVEEYSGVLQGTGPPPAAQEILHLAEGVQTTEWESALQRLVLEKAAPTSEFPKINDTPLDTVGVLLLNPDGSVRDYIIGGGGSSQAQAFTPIYFNFESRDWYREGDRVVLLYYSKTGSPNASQMGTFFSDATLFQEWLPGHPEFLMGTVGPDGLRLFAPNASPSDFKSWIQTLNQIQEVFRSYDNFQHGVQKTLFSFKVVENPLSVQAAATAERRDRIERMADFEDLLLAAADKRHGPVVAGEWMRGIRVIFGKRLAEVRASTQDPPTGKAFIQAIHHWGMLAHDILRAWWEKESVSLIGEGKPFRQVQIEGLTRPDPPVWPQPAAAAPDQPKDRVETLDAAAVPSRIMQLVPDILNGIWGPDQLAAWYHIAGGSELGFWNDVSSSPSVQFDVIDFPEGLSLIQTIRVPDPREKDPKAKVYLSRIVLPEIPSWESMAITLGKVVQETRQMRVKEPLDSLKTSVPVHLQRIKGLLETPATDGLTATVRLGLTLGKHQNQMEVWANALQVIYQTAANQMELAGQIIAAQRALQTPSDRAREILSPILSALGDWPETQQQLQRILDRFPESGTVRPGPVAELEALLVQLWRETRFVLKRKAPGPVLAELYEDGFRTGWLAQLDRLAERFQQGEFSDAMAGQVLWLEERITRFEVEASVTAKILKEAQVVPVVEMGNYAPPFSGIGVFFLRPDGKIRFLRGGGGISEPKSFATRFPPERVLQWAQPGETVILCYCGFTGPNLLHLEAYLQDRELFRRTGEGTPEVLAAFASPDGTVRVYRPIAVPPRLSQLSASFDKLHDIVKREFLDKDPIPEDQLAEMSHQLPEILAKWLVDAGAFDETDAQQVAASVRQLFPNELADIKRHYRTYHQYQKRKPGSAQEISKAQFQAARLQLAMGLAAVVSKMMMIAMEEAAKPLMVPGNFEEVNLFPKPAAPAAPPLKDLGVEIKETLQQLVEQVKRQAPPLGSDAEVQTFLQEWVPGQVEAVRAGRLKKVRFVDFKKDWLEHQKLWNEIYRGIAQQYEDEAKWQQDYEKAVRRSWEEEFKHQEEEARLARQIGEGISAEYAADEKYWLDYEEIIGQGWTEVLQKEEEERQRAEAARLADQERLNALAQQGAKRPVQDLSTPRKPPAPPPVESSAPVPVVSQPALPSVVAPPALPAVGQRAEAAAEVERIENRLTANLASPDADLDELLKELENVNRIPADVLNAAMQGRRTGIRMALGGAISGRFFTHVEQELARTFALPLDQAEEPLRQLSEQAHKAAEALKESPVFQGPVSRQIPVVDGTREARYLRVILSDPAASGASLIHDALQNAAGIPEDHVHRVWREAFRSDRQGAAESLALGTTGWAEGEVDKLVGSAPLPTPEQWKEGLAPLDQWIRIAGGFMDGLQMTGEYRDNLKTAEEGIRQLQRLAELDLKDHSEMAEQALVDSKTPLANLPKAWGNRLRLALEPVAVLYEEAVGGMTTESDEKRLEAMEKALELLKQLGLAPQLLGEEKKRLQDAIARKKRDADAAARKTREGEADKILSDPAGYTAQQIAQAIVGREKLLNIVRSDSAGGSLTSGLLGGVAKTGAVSSSQASKVRKHVDHRLKSDDAKLMDGLTPLYKTLQILLNKLPSGKAAGAEEDLTEEDRAKIPGLPGRVREAAEALLPVLRRSLRDKSRLEVLITDEKVPDWGVGVSYSDGSHWISGVLSISSVSRDKDASRGLRVSWLRKRIGQKVPVYVRNIQWSKHNHLYIDFKLASPTDLSAALSGQDRFEAKIRGFQHPKSLFNYLSELETEQKYLIENLLAWYAMDGWKGLEPEIRREIMKWLADRPAEVQKWRDSVDLFKEAASDPAEAPWLRWHALRGMAAAARSASSRTEVVEAARAFWAAPLGEEGERLRSHLYFMGQRLSGSEKEWRALLGIPDDWRPLQSLFAAEMWARKRDWEKQSQLLSWLKGGDLDFLPWVVYHYGSPALWKPLPEPGKGAALAWILKQAQPRHLPEVFEFLGKALYRSVDRGGRLGREAQKAAAQWMAQAAPRLPDRATAFETLQRVESRLRLKGQGYPGWIETQTADILSPALEGLRPPQAGMEENTVFFLQADLFGPVERGELEDGLMLAGIGIDLRQALGSDREVQLVLVSGGNLAAYRKEYAGWRIIMIRREQGSDPRSLPIPAIPVVAAAALERGAPEFEVDVLEFLYLQQWTLPQALEQLTHASAA